MCMRRSESVVDVRWRMTSFSTSHLSKGYRYGSCTIWKTDRLIRRDIGWVGERLKIKLLNVNCDMINIIFIDRYIGCCILLMKYNGSICHVERCIANDMLANNHVRLLIQCKKEEILVLKNMYHKA